MKEWEWRTPAACPDAPLEPPVEERKTASKNALVWEYRENQKALERLQARQEMLEAMLEGDTDQAGKTT